MAISITVEPSEAIAAGCSGRVYGTVQQDPYSYLDEYTSKTCTGTSYSISVTAPIGWAIKTVRVINKNTEKTYDRYTGELIDEWEYHPETTVLPTQEDQESSAWPSIADILPYTAPSWLLKKQVTRHGASNIRFCSFVYGQKYIETGVTTGYCRGDVESVIFTFEQVSTVTISTNSIPRGTGSIRGGGQYNIGSSVTLSAVSLIGSNFLYWKNNAGTKFTSNPLTFTATSNDTYTAYFETDKHIKVVIKTPPDVNVSSGCSLHINNESKSLSPSVLSSGYMISENTYTIRATQFTFAFACGSSSNRLAYLYGAHKSDGSEISYSNYSSSYGDVLRGMTIESGLGEFDEVITFVYFRGGPITVDASLAREDREAIYKLFDDGDLNVFMLTGIELGQGLAFEPRPPYLTGFFDKATSKAGKVRLSITQRGISYLYNNLGGARLRVLFPRGMISGKEDKDSEIITYPGTGSGMHRYDCTYYGAGFSASPVAGNKIHSTIASRFSHDCPYIIISLRVNGGILYGSTSNSILSSGTGILFKPGT